MQTIKEIYANLQAESPCYPGVAGPTIGSFCATMNFVDKQFSENDSDLAFKAAQLKDPARIEAVMDEKTRKAKERALAQATQEGGDSDLIHFLMVNSMARHDFIEYLVRVVNKKCIETGQYSHISKALPVFIERNVKSRMGNMRDWQGFRDKELWTLEVNDCLQVNLDGLQKVYDKFKTKKYMKMKDAHTFM